MPERDGNIDSHSVPIKKIHSSVAQVVIITTEDKPLLPQPQLRLLDKGPHLAQKAGGQAAI